MGGIVLAYACIAGAIIAGLIPAWGAVVFLSLPIAWNTISHAQKNYEAILELIPANASMITLNFIFGILLTLSFLAGAFL